MLLELTSTENLPVFLNPFAIESICQLIEGSMVSMASSDQFFVKEDAADIYTDLTNLMIALQGGVDVGAMH